MASNLRIRLLVWAGHWGENSPMTAEVLREASAALAASEARAERMREALERIAAWDLPLSGKFYPNADGSVSDRPVPYDSSYAYGSEGGKRAIQDIARAALSDTTSAKDQP